jgi:hypothetical protein
MTFPDDWPQGCPPADAADANGEVFRIVKADPLSATDFRSYHEMGIARGDPVLRCGLSVFRLRSDAEHVSRMFPNLGKVIARATLRPEHGKVKQTGRPSHTTWWPYVGVDRVSLFEVVGVVT